LNFTKNIFSAERNESTGYLKGNVDKSEFNWKVNQISPNSYQISRAGPKFNSTLNLMVENGLITGEYKRPGPNIDWNIHGTYNSKGDVKIEIDAPLTLGITLEGKISRWYLPRVKN